MAWLENETPFAILLDRLRWWPSRSNSKMIIASVFFSFAVVKLGKWCHMFLWSKKNRFVPSRRSWKCLELWDFWLLSRRLLWAYEACLTLLICIFQFPVMQLAIAANVVAFVTAQAPMTKVVRRKISTKCARSLRRRARVRRPKVFKKSHGIGIKSISLAPIRMMLVRFLITTTTAWPTLRCAPVSVALSVL